MTNLPERLTDLADSLDACEWNHPLGSAEACRQAAKEIETLRDRCKNLAMTLTRALRQIPHNEKFMDQAEGLLSRYGFVGSPLKEKPTTW
jgi:hypothetical protein